jgi:nucleoside-diphosphate-sugar epimerase
VELVKGDLADAEALTQLTTGADVVVHLAGALMGLDRAAYLSVNELGTRALADAAQRAGVRPGQAQKSPDQRGLWMRTRAFRP